MARIGIDIRMMGLTHGGIGRYVKELVLGLLSRQSEIQFVLFYNQDLKNDPVFSILRSNKNVELVEVNIRHYSFREQWHFYRILEKHKLDLVHFPNFNVPLAYNKPFVVTIHDMVHHKISGAKKSRWLHFYAYKKIIEHAARQSRKIITVSEQSKLDIASLLQVSKEKICVTYEGVSMPNTVAENQVAIVKNRYFLRKPYFLFVGVLERKKNLVMLARGFDVFIKKYQQDMDLVVVGKADAHYPEIRHKILDIKNRNRIVLTDFVSEQELSALYRGAYAYVSASLHEGFGLPGIEAMGYGLPLAVSNTAVFNEIYDNAAIYFDPLNPEDIAEKLQLLARDAGFRQKISENSLLRAGLFDWQKTAAQTEDLYVQSLTQEGGAL